jgi:hypothetical protein
MFFNILQSENERCQENNIRMSKASKLSGLRDQSGISKFSVLAARQNAQTTGVDHLIEFAA